LVGGKEVKPSHKLKVGDIVEIKFGTGTVKFVINELKETVRKEEASSLYTVISE
jgi:ribosomal 50S subunit-recycling heat shock protein